MWDLPFIWIQWHYFYKFHGLFIKCHVFMTINQVHSWHLLTVILFRPTFACKLIATDFHLMEFCNFFVILLLYWCGIFLAIFSQIFYTTWCIRETERKSMTMAYCDLMSVVTVLNQAMTIYTYTQIKHISKY